MPEAFVITYFICNSSAGVHDYTFTVGYFTSPGVDAMQIAETLISSERHIYGVFKRTCIHFEAALQRPRCHRYTLSLMLRAMFLHLYSFYPRTIIQWNLLPIHVHEAVTVDAFKVLVPVTVLAPIYHV